LVCLAPVAFAQAWVQPKGEGYVSFSYQNWYARNHLLGTGAKVDLGHMFTQVASLGMAYGVTERFTVTADLPLVLTRYAPIPGDLGEGAHGHRPHTIDDGAWHAAVTDLRLEARFNASLRPFAITPFFGALIPTNRYETFGHAVPGRDMREYQVGVAIGRQLDPILSRAYFDLRYGYSFVQEIANINTDRSNVDLQLGYFLSQRLSMRAFGAWQRTHEGLELPVPASSPLFVLHDRLQRTHFMRGGGAVAYSLRRSWDVFAFVATSISGKNTHAPIVVGVGVSRSFSLRSKPENLNIPDLRQQREKRILAATRGERQVRIAMPDSAGGR